MIRRFTKAAYYNTFLIFFLAIIGMYLVWLNTYRYGSGVSTDSVSYLAGAKGIAVGKGCIGFDGEPMTLWPPFFSAMLSIPFFLKIDPLIWARNLGIIQFGILVFTASLWFRKNIKSMTLFIMASILITINPHYIKFFSLILSDYTFVLLSLLFLIFFDLFLKTFNIYILLLTSVFAGLACITRYIGITLIISGAIILLMINMASLARRIYHTIIFIALSSLPLSLWLLRNFIISSTPFGPRSNSGNSLTYCIAYACGSVVDFLTPLPIMHTANNDLPSVVNAIRAIAILISAILITYIYIKTYPKAMSASRPNYSIWLLLIFTITYSSFNIIMSSRANIEPPNTRYLLPILLPIIMLFSLMADRIIMNANTIKLYNSFKCFLYIIFTIWICIACQKTFLLTIDSYKNGMGWITGKQFQNSSFLNHLKSGLPEGVIYSNVPDAVYFFSGSYARYWKNSSDSNKYIAVAHSQNKDVYYAHVFAKGDKLSDINLLEKQYRIMIEKKYEDGVIYRIGPRLLSKADNDKY